MSVDLPEPDGPMTAVNWPTGTSMETPRSACTADSPSPYWRVTRRAETAMSRAGRAAVEVRVSIGSFGSGGQAGQAASAARRDTACVSAPAESRALVASPRRRPVMPLPLRTETEA